MTSIDYADRVLAKVKLHCPAAGTAAINLELFDTLNVLFEEANVWRWDSQVPLVANEDSFPIFPPSGTGLVRVMYVTHNGAPVQPANEDPSSITIRQQGRIVGTTELDGDALFAPNTTQSPGGVFRYAVYFPRYINTTIPISADAAIFPLVLQLALKLDDVVLEDPPSDWPIEPWIWQKFYDAITEGLIGNLMSHPVKPYTNPTLALMHLKQFKKLKARYRMEVEGNFQYGAQTWVFPRWS